MSGDRHGWNAWDAYLAVHESVMEGYRGHFIVDERLSPVVVSHAVYWRGRLLCASGLEIEVDKSQVTRRRGGRLEVKTVDYKYHVQQRTETGVRKLFRYDDADHHPGHPSRHHRHAYRAGDADDAGIVTHVGYEGWPTLGDVIGEAFAWWEANCRP